MENCLVTTLKGIIDNDKLDYLGTIHVTCKTDADSDIYMSKLSGKDVTVKVLTDGITITHVIGDNGSLIDSKNALLPDNASGVRVRFSAANTDVELLIRNKYYVTTLQGIQAIHGNIKACYELLSFYFDNRYNTANLNVSQLSDSENLSKLQLSSGWFGNIKEVAVKEDLTYCVLSRSNISGAVEDFVAVRKHLAQDSGNISMNVTLTHITFKAEVCQEANTPLIWQPNSVNSSYTDISHDNRETTIIVDANGNWTYANSDMSKYNG